MLRQAESYTVPIQSTEAVAACGAEKVMIVSKLPRGPSTTRTDWPGKSIPFLHAALRDWPIHKWVYVALGLTPLRSHRTFLQVNGQREDDR